MSNPTTISRIPPQSIDAEKALLGSILIKQDAIFEIMEYIHPESFYAQKHEYIFQAMLDLFSQAEPIDMLTLSHKLAAKEKLDIIGGEVYLAELAGAVPSSTNVEHYAQIVFNTYIKRRIIDAASTISDIGYEGEAQVEEVIDKAEKELFAISQDMSSSDFIDMNTLAKEASERLMALQDGKSKLRGVPTGFASLDRKLSGFQPGDMIILAARPSVGKTSLALDFVRKIAVTHKKSVAFFSLEMSKDQLMDRMLSAESRVDYWKMRTGSLTAETDFTALQDGLGRLSESRIYIDDNSYNNILRMKSAARKLKRKHGLDILIVDYLQLMAPVTKSNSIVQEVTEISRGLKQLAKELDIPVIALSQLSRNIEHRGDNAEPRLADLRDSGSIEQDADIVMFIHRPKEEGETTRGAHTKLIIEKHRNGATGVIDLYFDPERTSFNEVDSHHEHSDFELSDDDDED